MAMSQAERSQRWRDRQKERDETVPVLPVPDADSGSGELLSALEVTLQGISAPDPVLVALARRMAAVLDASQAVNYQLAAELRRTVNDLRGRSVPGAAKSGLSGGRVRPNRVAALRGDYQAARSKRSAS